MTLDLQSAATRRMRRLIGGLILAVLVLVALVVFLAVRGSGGNGSNNTGAAAPTPEQSSSAPSDPAVEDPDEGYVAPEQYVALPAAKSTGAKNLPTGFPHTPEGAVAMVVASSRNAYTLDEAKLRAGLETYTVQQYRDVAVDAADDSIKYTRQSIGLPETGTVPAGATLAAWPLGVKWTAKDADHVQVLILLKVTSSPGAGQQETTKLVTTSAETVWEDGDWKTQPNNPGKLPDPVDLGTSAFNTAGWKAIQEGDRL